MKVTFNSLMIMYAVFSVVLAGVGYYLGEKKGNSMEWSTGGLAVGVILSIIAWYTVGKKYIGKSY
jgi:hypothetical protein